MNEKINKLGRGLNKGKRLAKNPEKMGIDPVVIRYGRVVGLLKIS